MKFVRDLGRGARRAARPARSAATGGLLFWAGTSAIGVSTVLLLALFSRHHREGFSGLSTLFALFFVASLIPSGVPLRSAALAVDGAKPPRLTALSWAPGAGGDRPSPLWSPTCSISRCWPWDSWRPR